MFGFGLSFSWIHSFSCTDIRIPFIFLFRLRAISMMFSTLSLTNKAF